MQYPDPETGKMRETAFVITEKFPNDRHVRAIVMDLNPAKKKVYEMFGARSPQACRSISFVKSDFGRDNFQPESGILNVWQDGSETGVRIEWKWVTA